MNIFDADYREIKKQLKIIQEQLADQLKCNGHVIRHMQSQNKINDLLRTEVKALQREVQAVLKGNRNPFNIPEGASILPDGHGGYRVFETLDDLKDPWPGEGEKA